ncbi:MAG: hypothetical protein KF819_40515 [Labilithrix sp.]|nr:hypothetical protein [Labilithrix sp.]
MLLIAILAFARRAGAAPAEEPQEIRRARAETLFREAEKDDEAFAFARALGRYDEARAADPTSPRAPRAEARAAILRAHAEGDFVPFTKLERVRRDPALSSDPAAIDALVSEAETFPEGRVRVEAWVLAAEAYAHRFGRPGDAMRLLRRVVVDAKADPVLARKAARDLVGLHLGAGDLAGATEAARLAGDRADPKLARDVARAARRQTLHYASICALLAIAALAARAVVAAARRGTLGDVASALRKIGPLVVAYAAYVAIAGGVLASRYEQGNAKPFLSFGVVLVPLFLVARAWGAAGGARPAAKAARAVACAAGAIGAGFLVLESVDVAYLEGLGL